MPVSAGDVLLALINEDASRALAAMDVPDDDAEFRAAFLTAFVQYHEQRDALAKRERRSAWRTGADKHVHAEQAIFELLQNAMAVGARAVDIGVADVDGRPWLLCAHDGRPFRAVDVFAFVVPHDSAKRGDAASPGQFGTGITSLAAWGDHIVVQDARYQFAVNSDGHPTYIDLDLRRVGWVPSGATTVIGVRMTRAEDAADKLRAWVRMGFTHDASAHHAALLAFGSDLRTVRHHTGDDAQTWEYDEAASLLRGPAERTIATTHRHEVISIGATRKLKASAPTTPITLVLTEGADRVAYTPLPVTAEACALPFLVSADFDPTESRERLRGESAWNAALWKGAGQVAARWFQETITGHAATNAWRIVPTVAPPLESGASTVAAEMHTVLLGTACLRDEHGTMRHPRSVCFASLPGLRELLPERVLHKEIDSNVSWIDPALADGQAAIEGLKWLGATEIGAEDLQWIIEMENPPDGTAEVAWRNAAARWLAERKLPLAALPVLVDRDGRLRAPCRGLAIVDRWDTPERSRNGWAGHWLDAMQTLEQANVVVLLHPGWDLGPAGGPLDRALREAGVRRLETLGPPQIVDLLEIERSVPIRASVGLLNVLASQLRDGRDTRLPAQVGRNIEVEVAWSSVAGRPERGWAKPVDAYISDRFRPLSKRKDSTTGSAGWGSFAEGVPTLRWISDRYVRDVESESRTARNGALALFNALGALPVFRVVPDVVGSNKAVDRKRLPASQRNLFDRVVPPRAGGTILLADDATSPDLDLAMAHVARLSTRERLRRADLLLNTLLSHWSKLKAFAQATPMHQEPRQWYPRKKDHDCPATWIASLGDQPWIATQGKQLAAPSSLYWPNALNLASRDKSELLTARGTQDMPVELRVALGIRESPPTLNEILDMLTQGRERSASSSEMEPLYVELDRRCMTDATGQEAARIVTWFRAAPSVLCTDGRWRSPAHVVDDAAHGLYGAAVGYLPRELRRLPRLLRAIDAPAKPSLQLHADVWRDLASGDIQVSRDAQLSIVTATLADAVTRADELLPVDVWLPTVGGGWARAPDLVAVDDAHARDALVAKGQNVLEPVWPTWRIAPFLERKKIPCLTRPTDVAVDAPIPLTLTQRHRFSATLNAVIAVVDREFPAEIERARSNALSVEAMNVVVGDGIATWKVRRISVDAGFDAVMSRDGRLIARDAGALSSDRGFGRIVADLLRVEDRRRIELEWMSAWASNSATVGPLRPATLPDRDKMEAEAEALRRRKGKSIVKGATQPAAELRTRTLPTGHIALRDVTTGPATPSPPPGAKGQRKKIWKDPKKAKGKTAIYGARIAYTSEDKEAYACDLLRLAWGGTELEDLRTAFGSGTDFFDHATDRAIEFKTFGGPADKQLRFTHTQVETATRYRNKFLLVVAENLESLDETVLHLIPDPLAVLRVGTTSHVVLEGLRDHQHIHLSFQSAPTDGHEPDVEDETDTSDSRDE
jgi:hypothetical protein